MKQKLFLFSIAVLCAGFFLPLFKPSFYVSHDGEAHVARFAAYYKAYQDGQIPPRWAEDLNHAFGSPVFIFYYPLPGTLASGLHFFGLSLENSFKLMMTIGFIGAALSFYVWVSSYVSKNVAFVGSLLYGLAPYHFLNLYVRGDIAEIMALAIVPLVFFCIDKVIKHGRISALVWGSILYALLILSHNAISLMFSPVIFLYVFIAVKNTRKAFPIWGMLIMGLLLSSFFWVPALYESKYTNANLFIGNMYQEHFLSISSLVYSQWGFGPDTNKVGGLSPQIGPLYVVLFFVALAAAIKKMLPFKAVFWLIICSFSVFMTIDVSWWIWEKMPLIKLFQFPWRFTALSSFAICVLAVFILNKLDNKKFLFMIVFILLITSIPFIKVEKYIARDDNYYLGYKGTTYYHGQASSIWTAGDAYKYPESPIEIISGDAKISNIVRRSVRHLFTVDAKTDAKILDNTVYFPGWQVRVDRKKVPIEFQDINHRGLITFSVTRGVHKIEVVFRETPVRLIADLLSLFAIIVVILIIIFRKRLQIVWNRV